MDYGLQHLVWEGFDQFNEPDKVAKDLPENALEGLSIKLCLASKFSHLYG